MENQLVSFIVPIYNVERCLARCIDSLIAQTYKHIEVILVDDGSPDNCASICDEYAMRDDRIKVIHKANGGASDARNTGLSAATGDYVVFVDSDDFWTDKHSLEFLVSEMTRTPDCDFIEFLWNYYYEDSKQYVPIKTYNDKILNASDKNDAIIEIVKTGSVPMSACLKIIKRSFLVDNKINFIKGIYVEDIVWCLVMMSTAYKFRVVNHYAYAYSKMSGVQTVSKLRTEKMFNDICFVINHGVQIIENSDFLQSAKDALLSFMGYELCILLGKSDRKWRDEHRKELQKLYYLLNYTTNPKVRFASIIYRIFGAKIMTMMLGLFIQNKGFLRRKIIANIQ